MGSLVRLLVKSLFAKRSPEGGCKMAIVVRTDVPMGKGKVGAQCAHAALECYRRVSTDGGREVLDAWLSAGQPKIVLRVSSDAELLALARDARAAGLVTAIIKDAGRTQLAPGTISAVGIGPGPKSVVERVTSRLKLL